MPSVERVRWARFRVIVTTLVGLTILSTLVVLLTGGTLFEPHAEIYLFLPDATGIAAASPVRVDGVQVGKVDSVTLSGSSQPNRVVMLKMIVERGRLASVTEDSTAETASETLVGDKFIKITSGTAAGRVQPGQEIRFKASADLTKDIDLSKFRKQMLVMDDLLTQIENGEGLLGQFVMGDQMYRELRDRMGEVERAFHTAADKTSAVGREIYGDALYGRVREPFLKLNETLAKLQSGQGSAGQFLRDSAQYDQVRAQITDLRKSIADVRSMEVVTSDAMYEDWNRSVAGWIRMVDEVNVTPMLGTTAVYDNLNGMAKELQGTVKDFRGNPKKFLRLKVF